MVSEWFRYMMLVFYFIAMAIGGLLAWAIELLVEFVVSPESLDL